MISSAGTDSFYSYALSTLLSYVTRLKSIASLRALNGLLLPSLIFLILDYEIQLSRGTSRRGGKTQSKGQDSKSVPSLLTAHQLHTALNVTLFPPLFFFSGLYYTDVASVVSVLLFWNHFLRVNETSDPSIFQHLLTVVLGLASLTFRQTNIFWVSIFPAAILLVSKVDIGLEDAQGHGRLLDSPVRESYADGKSRLCPSIA